MGEKHHDTWRAIQAIRHSVEYRSARAYIGGAHRRDLARSRLERREKDGARIKAMIARRQPLSGVRIADFTWIGAGSYTRSEEHTSELQSLMRISYAVFCLKKKKKNTQANI